MRVTAQVHGRRRASLAGRALTVLAGIALVIPVAAGAPGSTAVAAPPARGSEAPARCPGDPIAADRVITGEFASEQQGSYVLLPFSVPAGTTAVRVKYCHDQPESPTSAQLRHTLDLGLYDARRRAGDLFGVREFRGWGGSSHPDTTVSAEGFSSEAQYLARPKGNVPGRTTRGFSPGPVKPGEWAVELGLASIIGRSGGDRDGKVAYRVEIELSDDPAFADEPYRPAPYRTAPARAEAGWYAGDLHVHAEHSALGDATMNETFDYAFGPRGAAGAGLDFITLSDYVVGSHWDEIGRYQPRYPGRLIMRSAEIITYRGHTNNTATGKVLDYRTGPVLERRRDGSLVRRRGPRAPSTLFDAVRRAGGFTQINHPTIFPSAVPLFAALCRGCPWDYSDAETRYEKVDAYEVHTGPPGNDAGNNPFTTSAIREWEDKRRAGFDLTAVGVSDSHNAGRTPGGATQAPIGVGTTVVRADELSEDGIRRGVQAGHAFVKVFGPGSPDIRFEATSASGTAIMGDALPEERAQMTARVLGGGPGAGGVALRQLMILRDGRPLVTVPITSDDFSFPFASQGRGDYRIQVLRGAAVEVLANPISLGPNPPGSSPAGAAAPMRLSVFPRSAVAGRRTRFTFRATRSVAGRRRAVAGATVRFAGARGRTGADGRVTLVRRIRRARTLRARAERAGFTGASAPVRIRRAAPRFAG